ncbi:MAG: hypothetical protein HXY50_08820 [Ignavibacteriaceae bacterium]|nr:hypothetical protein [Ignavibacteriaceae bacterium]
MRKALFLLMIIVGTILIVVYTYVFTGFAASNPLFRWTIFVEPMIFSALLILIGILLVVLGIVFIKQLKRNTLH